MSYFHGGIMGNKINYDDLDLKVGLEIHQQLDTKSKLFCNCPTKLVSDEANAARVIRALRATKSELGEVDEAALFEYKRGRLFEYIVPGDASCLVELDEEPPHPLNREALIIAIAIAKALNARIVDEVHVMRKIVIDGSNTTGFQRTAIIALGGYIDVPSGRVGIQTIALEEDAARKVKEERGIVTYNLDRLGIPLIEVSTAPDIKSPEQARQVAETIGLLMRLTRRVKRGIGTIRQDLNISIKGGTKIEIKGVQRLELVSKIVEYEVMRQLRLLEICEELKRRNVCEEDIKSSYIVDVTEIFSNTKSKLIKKATKKGAKVFVLKLPNFRGILGIEIQPGRRFGTELADYAKQWGGVGGIIHSDELPNYGITKDEVLKVFERIDGDPSKDAFVLVLADAKRALKALEAVRNRCIQALYGVPKETRAANPDGTTHYMRPQPGAARMYPETDIPPIEITKDILEEAERIKPPSPEEKIRELMYSYKLHRELAEQLLYSPYLNLFEELATKIGSRLSPTVIASTLTSTLKSLKGEG
ncbi:MAG: Glu-tRNA(Gln) amidotransferase GatDE subunit E, partial [Thermoprotei archaeon]